MMRVFRWLVVMVIMVGSAVAQKGATKMEATGTFEVKMGPTELSEFEKKAELGRYTIDKVWHGDFEGTSIGEMVSEGEASTGAMAYVAMEKMSGTLAGKKGTFVFTHAATMMKGDAKSGVMKIGIVPGSGTGELKGITGTLTIVIDAAGKHSWVLEYVLQG